MAENKRNFKDNLSEADLSKFNLHFETNKKSKCLAWILLLLMGSYGLHSFYLGDFKRGYTYLILTVLQIITSVVFVWGFLFVTFISLVMVIYDIFKINSQVNEHNYKLELDTINEILSSK